MRSVTGTSNKFDEITNMCEPIIEYLTKHHDPHTRVIISVDSIEIITTELGIPLECKTN